MSARDIAFFGTFPAAARGSRAASETIADGLVALGHRVKLVSRRERPHQRVTETLAYAATGRFDLAVLDVYSTRVLYLTAAVASLLQARGVPWIAVLHGGRLALRYDELAGRLRRVLDGAARIVTPSSFLQAEFAARGHDVDCIPNALALERFPYRARTSPSTPPRLVWVRAFSEEYRPQLAVDVVHALHRRGAPVGLTMVGPDHGLQQATSAHAASLGLGQFIRFLGPVPNDRLFALYHEHDYLLNTTRYESFGVAVAEAAATGLPTISAAVGELAHAWRDGRDMLLVPGGRAEEYADRLLATRSGDYAALSLAAHEHAVRFDARRVLARWQELVSELATPALTPVTVP